ncbi:DUF1049 domain-containing protein [Alteromonas sp. 345S023]|uniref:Probable lipopolysaccharide assembly protein A n=1 Tax=Alteromonas profundi TaxID=2696062 RepID=A0A7X5LKW0_9ALTE|nr:LapA family protein [Alteromonas profundi]NDV91194.1 DUF1049 domain-containing protein [Alteromonas profundi]
MKGILTIIVVLILLVIAFVIGSQNQAEITVNYLIAQSHMRLSSLMGIVLALGVVIGIFIMSISWLQLRLQLGSANSKINRLKKDQ